MIFWLGCSKPAWLERTAAPLFLSHRTLAERKRLPRALGSWALDSGAFTELGKHGRFEASAEEYAEAIGRYASEIGGLAWAAPQDWLCAPPMLEATGLSVAEHQRRTVRSVVELRQLLGGEIPVPPVLQGWAPDDYLRCADRYEAEGLDLSAEPLVGIGSVAARERNASPAVAALVQRLAGEGLALHGFGITKTGVRAFGEGLASADSQAWSYAARREPPLPGCSHKSCSQCLRWALRWRADLLAEIERAGLTRQLALQL